jgi:hypothetical protein
MGFEISCADAAAVEAAYDFVKACDDCSTTECTKNWAIVEAHHDLCLHDEIPKRVEHGFHDLEAKCPHACLIGRKSGGLVDCPVVNCADADTVLAAFYAGSHDCATWCTGPCGAAYKQLRAFHDVCDMGLDLAYEKLLHDLEEPCEAHNCWAESPHCTSDPVDSLTLGQLEERSFEKCKMTEAEAKKCLRPEDPESAALATVFLAFFVLG